MHAIKAILVKNTYKSILMSADGYRVKSRVFARDLWKPITTKKRV